MPMLPLLAELSEGNFSSCACITCREIRKTCRSSSSRIDAMSAFEAMSTWDSVLSPFSACVRACQR